MGLSFSLARMIKERQGSDDPHCAAAALATVFIKHMRAGGTHHAFADRGEGFCVFNDIAVSAAYAMDVHKIERILVIDLGAAPSV